MRLPSWEARTEKSEGKSSLRYRQNYIIHFVRCRGYGGWLHSLVCKAGAEKHSSHGWPLTPDLPSSNILSTRIRQVPLWPMSFEFLMCKGGCFPSLKWVFVWHLGVYLHGTWRVELPCAAKAEKWPTRKTMQATTEYMLTLGSQWEEIAIFTSHSFMLL